MTDVPDFDALASDIARLSTFGPTGEVYRDLSNAISQALRHAYCAGLERAAEMADSRWDEEHRNSEYGRGWQDALDFCETDIRAEAAKVRGKS